MYSLLDIVGRLLLPCSIVMVLLQSSKGGGLAGTFGGASNWALCSEPEELLIF